MGLLCLYVECRYSVFSCPSLESISWSVAKSFNHILWIDRRSLISSEIFVAPVELAPREGIVTQVSSSKGGIGYLDNPFAKFTTFVHSPAETFHTPRLDTYSLWVSWKKPYAPCNCVVPQISTCSPVISPGFLLSEGLQKTDQCQSWFMCPVGLSKNGSFQILVNVFFAHPKLWRKWLDFKLSKFDAYNHQCMHHENWHVSIIKSVVSGIKLCLWGYLERLERPRWMPHPPHRWVVWKEQIKRW